MISAICENKILSKKCIQELSQFLNRQKSRTNSFNANPTNKSPHRLLSTNIHIQRSQSLKHPNPPNLRNTFTTNHQNYTKNRLNNKNNNNHINITLKNFTATSDTFILQKLNQQVNDENQNISEHYLIEDDQNQQSHDIFLQPRIYNYGNNSKINYHPKQHHNSVSHDDQKILNSFPQDDQLNLHTSSSNISGNTKNNNNQLDNNNDFAQILNRKILKSHSFVSDTNSSNLSLFSKNSSEGELIPIPFSPTGKPKKLVILADSLDQHINPNTGTMNYQNFLRPIETSLPSVSTDQVDRMDAKPPMPTGRPTT